MRFRVFLRGCALLLVAGLMTLTARHGETSTAVAQPPPRRGAPPPVAPSLGTPNVVRQGFPAAAADLNDLTKSDTAWEIEWDLTHPFNRPSYPPGSTLRIRNAKFMWKDKNGKPQWIVVARMLELAEIYVPYDSGWMAFLDIHDMPFHITPAVRVASVPARSCRPRIPRGLTRFTRKCTTTASAG